MSDFPSVHDRFIKAIMAGQKIARDYFEASLPAYIVEKLDFSTLRQLPDTYVSKELQSSGLKEEQIVAIVELLPATIKETVMTTLDVFIEKGKRIGLQEGLSKTVRNMLREGFSVKIICKVLEVTPEYVASIRSETTRAE